MNNKYKYDTGPSAADGYPAEMIQGSQVGSAFIEYGSYLSSTWGGSSSALVIDNGLHELPETIRVNFYSYVDDKFYQATHTLPQEQIKELLSSEFTNKDQKLRYYTFVVSVAPCGWVSVWLSGSAGQVEICSFRAEEANWDYKKIFPDGISTREEWLNIRRKSMYSFVKREISEKRVSSQYWEDLNRKYKWKLITNDPGFVAYNYSASLINAERRKSESNGNWLNELSPKPIPSSISTYLKHDKDPLRYWVWVDIVPRWDPEAPDSQDEAQTLNIMTRTRYLMNLFEKFYAQAGDEEVSLMFDFSHDMKSVQVKLVTATKEQVIEGCKIERLLDSDESSFD